MCMRQEGRALNLERHVEQLEKKWDHMRADYEALQMLFDQTQDQIVEQAESAKAKGTALYTDAFRRTTMCCCGHMIA